ncbi:NAD-dependent epimerase/dehydratase family protein, partial [Akkermansiaceae bacterium]|nr:NAD-dependent epimerase/dehydratase family protein [Akkermansiaceae bacterium]
MKEKAVGVIGASGQIGGHLSRVLIARGWRVVGFSRSVRENGDVVWRKWDGKEEIDLEGLSAVINLSGEAIDQRWTIKRKALF